MHCPLRGLLRARPSGGVHQSAVWLQDRAVDRTRPGVAEGLFFYPPSKIMTYSVFLVALFALAAGLSILETSANPFVISMGPEANSTWPHCA